MAFVSYKFKWDTSLNEMFKTNFTDFADVELRSYDSLKIKAGKVIQPSTLRPTPCTLHPTTCTLHPAIHTLHPTPYILHPTPYTLHLNPAPDILHPTP